MQKIFVISFLCLLWVFGILGCSGNSSTDTATFAENSIKPTRVVVRILNLDLALAAMPSETPTPIPPTFTPVILPTAIPIPVQASTNDTTTPTPSCINRAEFVKHLTISNNTALKVGQNFIKMWRIQNSGTCTWTVDYNLAFYSGEIMGAPTSVPLPQTVQPGETVDLQVPMIAPQNAATITGNWVLQDPQGQLFGFGETADNPIEVTIFVRPTPRPTPG